MTELMFIGGPLHSTLGATVLLYTIIVSNIRKLTHETDTLNRKKKSPTPINN